MVFGLLSARGKVIVKQVYYLGMVSSVQVEMYHTQLEIQPLLLLTVTCSIFQREQKHLFKFMSFLHIDMAQIVEILPQGCWCPGDARSQGISNHDIYHDEPN